MVVNFAALPRRQAFQESSEPHAGNFTEKSARPGTRLSVEKYFSLISSITVIFNPI
jgi:hypothetical protein